MRLALLLTTALLAPVVGAQECVPTTSPTDADAAGHYVVVDCEQPFLGFTCQGSLFSIWIYEESNGLAGLQRGDVLVDDTCDGVIAADTIVV